ncbi:MAG: peptide-methionine (S)-S-oxide reductase MsrA [Nitrosomonas sp.]|nr:peptide-methionine (S)-S-oxide reductase MsrA [Nitrosomonas sp.]MDP1950086.1 peptide-methionine (S)-S-oxide reductase MsrA [Nitrosomonas sp.]
MSTQEIIFGAGCFWSVEATFRRVKGVINAICGYAGGHTDNPVYSAVCTGTTGHIEVVKLTYDACQIELGMLLDTFWHCHNPTTRDQQGLDIGTQYRSAIFFYTPEQKVVAELSRNEFQKSGCCQNPIVTEILPATHFYPAEEFHQRYFEKHGIR